MISHALTIDLEDWHQLVRRRVTGAESAAGDVVTRATHRLLDLLDETGTRATFFTVGQLAAEKPELVREVARRGHEVGSHSYAHRVIYEMRRDEFANDVGRSRALLQDLTGQEVLGFRAPEFSVGSLDHWCFEVLAEAGFRYDSSVFPLPHARYGIPDAPRVPFRISTGSGALWEFPLATWDVRSGRIPVAGGTYYRLVPRRVLQRALAELDAGGVNAVLYFHPYEFHRGLLALSGLTLRQQLSPAYLRMLLLHNFATPLIVRRLRPILVQFAFSTLAELYRANTSDKEPSHA